MSEQKNTSVSAVACPYCHSHNYRVEYIPFGGGLIVQTLCGKCGLKSESMSDAGKLTFAFNLRNTVGPLIGN